MIRTGPLGDGVTSSDDKAVEEGAGEEWELRVEHDYFEPPSFKAQCRRRMLLRFGAAFDMECLGVQKERFWREQEGGGDLTIIRCETSRGK